MCVLEGREYIHIFKFIYIGNICIHKCIYIYISFYREAHEYISIYMYVRMYVCPLEEEMETHSSILAWEIPLTGGWQTTVHAVAKSWT